MTKILILQQLDNPAGDALEYQLLDRRSFLQFLGLTENGAIPDVKTIWLLRDRLAQAGVGAKLFDVPQQLLAHRTLAARCGRLLPKCDLGGQLRLAGLCR